MNTYKYKNMMFFDADTGGGEGGGSGSAGPAGGGTEDGGISRGATAFEPVVKQTTGDRPLPGEKPASAGSKGAGTGERAEGEQIGEGGEGKGEKVTPPAAFDPTKFAQEFGATFGKTIEPIIAGRQEQHTQMTAEEAKKLLKIWEPDDAWYTKYDNLETRKDAVAEMRDGIALQADTLNQYRMQEALDALRQELMPGFHAMQETANMQREQRLHTTYPTLAKPELQPLVSAIANDFVAKKQTFKTETELFKALATGVEAVLKVNNPEFKLETATANGSGTQSDGRSGGRQLPVSTPGGGGGTGRQTGGTKPEPRRGIAVFGK